MNWIRHSRVLGAVLLIGALSSARTVSGQVHWRSGASAPSGKSPAEIRTFFANPTLRDNAKHVVVQLDGPLTATRRNEFSNAGITILSYLGDNAFFASVSDGVDQAALSVFQSLIDAGKVDADWKLHPMLEKGEKPDWAIVPVPAAKSDDAVVAEKTWFAAYILFHDDVGTAESTAAVESHDGVIR